MQEDNPIGGADGEVEGALAALRPSAPGIDRDRLMFEAGARSGRQRIWMWRGVTGSLAAMLLVSVFVRPEVERKSPVANGNHGEPLIMATKNAPKTDAPVERVRNRWLDVLWNSPKEPVGPAQAENSFAVRQAVLERGLGALPNSVEEAGQRSTLQKLLDLRLQEPGDTNIFQYIKHGEAL
jgi:hypothetical protein